MGAPGTVADLVDHWVKRGRLPDHLRTAPKLGGTSRPVEGALTPHLDSRGLISALAAT